MTQWLVRLVGDEIDLKALSALFTKLDCRVVKDDDGSYYLTRIAFATMEGAEVNRAAREWLAIVNPLMGLRNLEPVALDGLYEVYGDGTRTAHHFGSAAMIGSGRVRLSGVVLGSNGQHVPSPEIELVRMQLEFAERAQNKVIRDALRFLNLSVIGDAAFWVNLNKAYDIVCADTCGDKRKRKQVIPRLDWKVTTAEMNKFEEAANNPAISGDTARHGDEWTTPQDVTAFNEGEAIAFIKHLLNNWLDWKAEQAG